MSDRIARAIFVVSLIALSFLWGAATVNWKLPPYRYLNKIEAGIVAWTKFEDQSLPINTIRLLKDGETIPAFQPLSDAPQDDLIVMTGHPYDLAPVERLLGLAQA